MRAAGFGQPDTVHDVFRARHVVDALQHIMAFVERGNPAAQVDPAAGMPISVFCAPASRANLDQWDQVLALLRQMGVRKIYDLSLGADICTWAHIRYIQKNNPGPLITQPCPAIVDYILLHHNELLPYLSPVHSPMLCTAIYMRRYVPRPVRAIPADNNAVETAFRELGKEDETSRTFNCGACGSDTCRTWP